MKVLHEVERTHTKLSHTRYLIFENILNYIIKKLDPDLFTVLCE